MRWLSLLVCFILSTLHLCASTQEEAKQQQETSPPAMIKVLLKKHAEGALVEVKGSYEVLDPLAKKTLSAGIKGKRFYLYPHKEGIKWGEDFVGIYQFTIVPTGKNSSILVDGVQYKGNLEVYHIDDHITLINEVDAENYLKCILTPRFATHIHDVVMDALAIVARTNVYYQILHNKEAYWHVDSKEVDYRGYATTLFNLNVDRAVDNTRFLVMTYEKQPFATTWNENCAGKTASYQSIFRKNVSSPGGIKSAFAERARKEHHWSFSVNKSKIAKIAQTNRVTNLDLYIDSNSEKVYAIRVQDGSHYKEVDFFHLQKGIGKNNLLSNDFTISVEGNSIIFDGFGEGCSVGLCIYSATQMAKRGDTAPEILATFYPYSHIEQIRSLPQRDFSFQSKPYIKPKKELKKATQAEKE
jgi:stage II sporulation protein D